jgi:hypothetical protein
MAAPGQPMSR